MTADSIIPKQTVSESVLSILPLIYKENNNGPKKVPCGKSDKTGAHLDFVQLTTTLCCLEHKNESIQRRDFVPYATSKQFAFEKFMINAFSKYNIHCKCINLSTFIQDLSSIIYYPYQLIFRTVFFPECMLPL